MRLFVSVLATAAMFFASSTAGAVEFTIVGDQGATVEVGDSVTIEINLTNLAAAEVFGIAASVSEYGNNVFVEGQAVSSYLDQFCPSPGLCFGGLSNLAGGALAESFIGDNGDRVQIALSAALTPVTATGVGIDQGLDTQVGSAQFSVTFTAIESVDILIGTTYQGDGITLAGGEQQQATGATFALTVIPEPGTALLMGLGLAGLASAGRRE